MKLKYSTSVFVYSQKKSQYYRVVRYTSKRSPGITNEFQGQIIVHLFMFPVNVLKLVVRKSWICHSLMQKWMQILFNAAVSVVNYLGEHFCQSFSNMFYLNKYRFFPWWPVAQDISSSLSIILRVLYEIHSSLLL